MATMTLACHTCWVDATVWDDLVLANKACNSRASTSLITEKSMSSLMPLHGNMLLVKEIRRKIH